MRCYKEDIICKKSPLFATEILHFRQDIEDICRVAFVSSTCNVEILVSS